MMPRRDEAMTDVRRVLWPRIIGTGVAAGIVGGMTIDLYLWLTTLLPTHGSILSMWQWVASALIGNAAYSSGSFVWLGLAVHFAASVCWAGGYAYLAQRQAFLGERWPISGFVYGGVVYIFMQLLLLGAGKFVFPQNPGEFLNAVIAYTVFFGMPVAYVVARMDRG
jgi:hypothetical protein